MKLTAVRGAVAEEALEKLHAGGDDERRRPVLGGKAGSAKPLFLGVTPLILRALARRHRTVVLQHIVRPEVPLEQVAVNLGRLLNDAGERDDDDDSAEPPRAVGVKSGVVGGDVLEGKCERAQGLAAACTWRIAI